ncbi:MAG: 6-phosphogluconolactonase [Salinibacterium sp.]|nr:MAG: 6-phosphogluconolactonase [Salinibacterium sp.]
MSNQRHVVVEPDKQSLAASVAALFIAKTVTLIEEFGEATVVLTGGTMGSAVLAAVNASVDRDSLDWGRVNVWWGDERWLPAGDTERNETQARAALLDHVPLDAGRVHPFAASDSGLDLDAAAAAYAAELAEHATGGATLPRFDITFLGVGPDGHVASLFPEHSDVREKNLNVLPIRHSPKPPPERLSLTLPAINSSSRVWLVLAGPDKASAFGLTLAGVTPDEIPAAGVEGRWSTIFFADADAAAEVPPSLIR